MKRKRDRARRKKYKVVCLSDIVDRHVFLQRCVYRKSFETKYGSHRRGQSESDDYSNRQ